jgi:ferredoxin
MDKTILEKCLTECPSGAVGFHRTTYADGDGCRRTLRSFQLTLAALVRVTVDGRHLPSARRRCQVSDTFTAGRRAGLTPISGRPEADLWTASNIGANGPRHRHALVGPVEGGVRRRSARSKEERSRRPCLARPDRCVRRPLGQLVCHSNSLLRAEPRAARTRSHQPR